MPFLRAMPGGSGGIKLRTSSCLGILTKELLRKSIDKVIKLCSDGGFRVKYFDTGLLFECLEDSFDVFNADAYSAGYYVEVIE